MRFVLIILIPTYYPKATFHWQALSMPTPLAEVSVPSDVTVPSSVPSYLKALRQTEASKETMLMRFLRWSVRIHVRLEAWFCGRTFV